jgi:hypothetical protein
MKVISTTKKLLMILIVATSSLAPTWAQEVFVSGAGSFPLALKAKIVAFDEFALTAHAGRDKRVNGFVILRGPEGMIKGHVTCLSAQEFKSPTGEIFATAAITFRIDSSTHPLFKAGGIHGVNLVDQGNPCDGAFYDLFAERVEKPCVPTEAGQPIECGNILIKFQD